MHGSCRLLVVVPYPLHPRSASDTHHCRDVWVAAPTVCDMRARATTDTRTHAHTHTRTQAHAHTHTRTNAYELASVKASNLLYDTHSVAVQQKALQSFSQYQPPTPHNGGGGTVYESDGANTIAARTPFFESNTCGRSRRSQCSMLPSESLMVPEYTTPVEHVSHVIWAARYSQWFGHAMQCLSLTAVSRQWANTKCSCSNVRLSWNDHGPNGVGAFAYAPYALPDLFRLSAELLTIPMRKA